MPLVMQHDDERVDALPVNHRVGAEGASARETGRGSGIDLRLDDFDVLASEQAPFTRVWVEAADGDPRHRRSHASERVLCRRDDASDPFARDHLDCLPHAAAQGAMDAPTLIAPTLSQT